VYKEHEGLSLEENLWYTDKWLILAIERPNQRGKTHDFDFGTGRRKGLWRA